ncbi:conserved hypothetical protein [Ricinus communis]|uniref:Uncharacterized protein n=1 Tax=Ricinus communis TaxID=3988 RepID=B9SWX9_RICCO|nr:conserved hypothetical protein [Ricinus communis]
MFGFAICGFRVICTGMLSYLNPRDVEAILTLSGGHEGRMMKSFGILINKQHNNWLWKKVFVNPEQYVSAALNFLHQFQAANATSGSSSDTSLNRATAAGLIQHLES